ncbi:MAG: hypothetical protein R6W73_07340 [Candidatus Saliniplasma sp.]
MKPEAFIEKGKIKTFRTRNHRFISSLAVKIVNGSEKRALIIDGSAKIDPYWIIRVCKELDLEEDEILTKILLCRGFTAYQLKDMVDKAAEIVNSDDSIIFIGLVDLSSRFLEDLKEEEGTWLRARCIRRLRKLVLDRNIYCAVADPYVEIFTKNSGGERYGEKCAHLSGGTR